MSEMPNWIFFIFFALFFVIFFVWNKRNKNYLTIEEKKLASSLLSEAFQREIRYAWIIIAATLAIYGFLLILEKVFLIENATKFIFVFCWFSLIYAFVRNRAIYRRANLPLKFINGDFALGIFTALAFAAISIFILLD